MAGILWLASYPKSGNTWLRAFLHNLMRNATQPIEPNRLNELTLGDGMARFFAPHAGGRATSDMKEEEIARLRGKVQRDLAATSPDTVFVKTHNWLGMDHNHPCIDMRVTAGAIYVVRNPLDVAPSLADHFGITLDQAIAQMADANARTLNLKHRVPDVMGSWSQHVKSWTAQRNSRLHVMRYEDMIAKPLPTFTQLTRFLGLPAAKDRIERAIRFSSFNMLRDMEARQGFVERSSHSKAFFRQGQAGGWRKILSAAQVQRLCADHQEQMQVFGYWPLSPADRARFAVNQQKI